MSKRITAVTMENFKGSTGSIPLTGRDFFVGPTGIGKSRILDAITISLLGYHPKQDKKPMALMKAFSSGNPMTVGIECEDGTKLSRTFEERGGKFSADVDIFPAYQEKGLAAKAARVTDEFGNFPVMFDISEFLLLSNDKQRDFVFKYLQSVGWDKEKVIEEMRSVSDDTKLIDTIFACWHPSHDTQTGLGNVIAYLKDQISYLNKRLKETEAAGRQITMIKQQQAQMSLSIIEKLKTEIEEHRARLNELSGELATINENNRQVSQQYNKKCAALAILKSKIADEDLSDRAAIENALKDATNEYADMANEDATEIRKAHDAATTSKFSIMKNKMQFERQAMDLAKLIESVQKQQCPLIKDKCLQDFTDLITQRKSDIENLKASINEHTVRANILDSQINTLKANLDEIDARRKTWQDMAAWIGKLKDGIKTIDDAATLESEIQSLPATQDITKLQAEVQTLTLAASSKQTQLTEAEKQKNTLSTLQVTLTDRKNTEESLNTHKALLAALGPKGIQGRIVKESLSPMLEDINTLLCQIDPTKQFYVELTDEKDNEVFEFMCRKDSGVVVPVTSMSSGESVIGYTALIAAFIKLGSPKGKYLLIDNMEHISNRGESRFRDNFLAGIDRIAEGFDNIILCGTEECTVPEGWNVVNYYETEEVMA